MDMLSVFITPCTKPTRIQCATISALRWQTSVNHAAYRASPLWPLSARVGKSRRMVKSTSCSSSGRSPREAGSSKLPKRMKEGATRHTTAPGSARGLPS